MKLFTLHDLRAGTFSDPVSAPNAFVILRNLFDQEFYKHHAEDFELVEIGTFDSVSSVFVSFDLPQRKTWKLSKELHQNVQKND